LNLTTIPDLPYCIKDARDDFDFYEDAAIKKSSLGEYENTMKRKKKILLRAEEFREGEVQLDGHSNFLINRYFVLLYRLMLELNRRKGVYENLHTLFSLFTEVATLHPTDLSANAIKLRELYKNDLAEPFVNGCLHFHGFLLSLEKTPTSILEVSDMFQAKKLKEVCSYVDIAVSISLCTPASNCPSSDLSLYCDGQRTTYDQ
jgi:hypothetical protein